MASESMTQADERHSSPATSNLSKSLERTVKRDCSSREPSGDPTSQDPTHENGLDIISRNVKKLVQGVQDLRHLGIEDFVLPLPKIVACGDQSAGKSSLIEGISEIKVPREAGCCTRCPVEINLTENSDVNERWICRVFLYKKYSFEGTQKNVGATRARPLGPWIPRDAEDQHFATTYDRNAVQDILYWAQLAILNPERDFKAFKPGRNSHTPHTMGVKFSPNVVRLDISGSNLPNLSFYDLPGVVNVAEYDHERYLVRLLRNLVKDYIKADDCINLLALPMSNDPANSTAAGIIMEMKAQGRTIGVLTKPDRVQEGESLEQWKSILNGDKLRLGLGYHVVKNNPNPTISHAVARVEEMEFFRSVEPYASQLEEYKPRFGTTQLQTALSHHLTAQILLSLPRIKEKIQKKTETVTSELNSLPKPLAGNLPMVIERCISTFSHKLKLHIDGGSPEYPFQRDFTKNVKDFQKELADSRPLLLLPFTDVVPRQASEDVFFLGTPGTPTPARRADASILIDDSDDVKPLKVTPRKRHIATATPRKRCRMEDLPMNRSGKDPAKRFSLADIRHNIQAGYISLPGSIDPRVVERMSRTSMEHWEDVLMSFLEKTKLLCEEVVILQIEESFRLWKQSRLYHEVLKICETFLGDALEQQQFVVKRSFALELKKPTTYNVEAIEHAYCKALEILQAARRLNRANSLLNEKEEASGKTTTGQARREKASKVTDTTLGPDPFSEEICVMSRVRGYYEWALFRFVDGIAMSFQGEWFENIRDKLPEALTRQLGIELEDANERCSLLLAVDPLVEERRIQLKKEQVTLAKAQDHLSKLIQDVCEDEESEITAI